MPRRPKGSGSIQYRPERGRYEGILRIDGQARYVSGDTPEDVDTKLRHLRADVERDIAERKRTPLTVAVFLRDWLERQVHGRREPSTYRGYKTYIERHIIPAIGSKQLSKLTPADVQTFINSRKLAPASIRQMRAILRKALHDAERWDLVDRNVVRLSEGPTVRKHRVEPLTPSQARDFLKAINEDRHEAIFAVAIGCGLRLGEILGLRWQDVGEGWLNVRSELQRVDGKYVLKDVKTEDSRRTVAMPLFVGAALGRQRKAQTNPGKQGLVFTTEQGKPVNGTWVTHRLYTILEGAKLPRQRFHDLRHCFASLLIEEGADLKEVKDVLGHSQVALTADLYGHLYASAKKRAADRIQRAIG